MPNRLAEASSPYLRQHAQNPVDWFPWGDEAFARAKLQDKPVFLSVGYSSCHWCHVMEHESFEDKEVAEILNRSFVSIKVDREERPDVDEAYMTAVQLQSGHGGWPMSVFLTPDKKPFLAGTYFPKNDRGQSAGFLSILKTIEQQWAARRSEMEAAANEFSKELEKALAREAPPTFSKLDKNAVIGVIQVLAADFDSEHGGFGTAPKFPPHAALALLLALAKDSAVPEEQRQIAGALAFTTLEAMALGGIHDHVGGGFHRYSTDAEWRLPHFEKMLYDNALLLESYANAARLAQTSDTDLKGHFDRVAKGIVSWLKEEMTSPEGLFYSAVDADTEGEEGKFYVWTQAEFERTFGERAPEFIEAFGIELEGNFLDESKRSKIGANVLVQAQDFGERFDQDLALLRKERAKRPKPEIDQKAVVSWNGLAIAGLSAAGETEMAAACASAIASHFHSGNLPHQIVNGKAEGKGFLDDYAGFAWGLLQLASATKDEKWNRLANEMLQAMVVRFYDGQGGFFSVSHEHERLFGRIKPVLDQPIPSGNALAVRCLARIGGEENLSKADMTLSALFGWMERAPTATEGLLLGGWEYLNAIESITPKAVASVGATADHSSPIAHHIESAVIPVMKRKVEVSLASQALSIDKKGTARGEVILRVPEGLHINSNDPPMRWLTPTHVETRPLKSRVEYPRADELGYFGEVKIPFFIDSAKSGSEFEVRVSFQACTESECLQPEEIALGARIV